MHGQQNIKKKPTLIVIISGISIEEGFSSVSKAGKNIGSHKYKNDRRV